MVGSLRFWSLDGKVHKVWNNYSFYMVINFVITLVAMFIRQCNEMRKTTMYIFNF